MLQWLSYKGSSSVNTVGSLCVIGAIPGSNDNLQVLAKPNEIAVQNGATGKWEGSHCLASCPYHAAHPVATPLQRGPFLPSLQIIKGPQSPV